jgi:thiamine biosynthesis lipoprotein
MAELEPKTFSYESMGTTWAVSVWDDLSDARFLELEREVKARSERFDETYSRFKPASLVWELAKKSGRVEVPGELVEMLRWYERLGRLSRGMLNPLVGFSLSDLGYDAEYQFQRKEIVRPVPDFLKTISIISDTAIEIREPVLIDLGALGKGYFVDRLFDFLEGEGIRRFLVNGSGDIRYSSTGSPQVSIRAGLEDPADTSKAIGVLEMNGGALCASAGNRRRWGENQTHIINPETLESPHEILAVWVYADFAVLADALATCLFFIEPEVFLGELNFEYLIMDSGRRVKRSAGFNAELFS